MENADAIKQVNSTCRLPCVLASTRPNPLEDKPRSLKPEDDFLCLQLFQVCGSSCFIFQSLLLPAFFYFILLALGNHYYYYIIAQSLLREDPRCTRMARSSRLERS